MSTLTISPDRLRDRRKGTVQRRHTLSRSLSLGKWGALSDDAKRVLATVENQAPGEGPVWTLDLSLVMRTVGSMGELLRGLDALSSARVLSYAIVVDDDAATLHVAARADRVAWVERLDRMLDNLRDRLGGFAHAETPLVRLGQGEYARDYNRGGTA